MERLTRRNENDSSYFIPQCFEKCAGKGCSEKCNDCPIEESIIDKLGAYEDAEEQGLILRLPCKVGDTVYMAQKGECYEYVVAGFHLYEGKIQVVEERNCRIGVIGKNVFLTIEEAEKKLASMQKG